MSSSLFLLNFISILTFSYLLYYAFSKREANLYFNDFFFSTVGLDKVEKNDLVKFLAIEWGIKRLKADKEEISTQVGNDIFKIFFQNITREFSFEFEKYQNLSFKIRVKKGFSLLRLNISESILVERINRKKKKPHIDHRDFTKVYLYSIKSNIQIASPALFSKYNIRKEKAFLFKFIQFLLPEKNNYLIIN